MSGAHHSNAVSSLFIHLPNKFKFLNLQAFLQLTAVHKQPKDNYLLLCLATAEQTCLF